MRPIQRRRGHTTARGRTRAQGARPLNADHAEIMAKPDNDNPEQAGAWPATVVSPFRREFHMSSLFSQVAEVFTRRQAKKVEDREALGNGNSGRRKEGPDRPRRLPPPWTKWTGRPRRSKRKSPAGNSASGRRGIGRNPRRSKRRRASLRPRATRKRHDTKPWSSRCRRNTPRTWTAVNGRYRYIVMRIPQAEGMREQASASYVGPLTDELDANRAKQGRVESGDPQGP